MAGAAREGRGWSGFVGASHSETGLSAKWAVRKEVYMYRTRGNTIYDSVHLDRS